MLLEAQGHEGEVHRNDRGRLMSHARRVFLATLAIAAVPALAAGVTIHVPSDQPTIQQGIDAASEGDTVLVASPYIYTGSLNRDLDFGGTNLILVSEGGAGFTVIDCDNAGRGFFFHSGEDTTAVVRGFTITNAVADTGAGAYCTSGSSPKFDSCMFDVCTAQLRGAGLACKASSPVVRDCEFNMNHVEDAARAGAYGGGVACIQGSSPLIADTRFVANYAYTGGAGLRSHSSSPQVIRCEFMSNTTADYGIGAGVSFIFSDGAALLECVFDENGVPTDVGGGAHINASEMTITDCDFTNNISGASGGMHMTGTMTPSVTGCTFIGNTGAWSAAGGLQCVFDANAVITNCTFVDNGTHQIWCDTASPTVQYSILAFSRSGLAIYCESEAETPSIDHCFVFGNDSGDTLCGGNFTDIEYTDPRLCDIEEGNVELCADSPCLPGATWVSLVGAEGQGCGPCGSGVEESTWGRIKAMYR